ncbi:MAG: FAD-binding protein [Terricaulis sp.]
MSAPVEAQLRHGRRLGAGYVPRTRGSACKARRRLAAGLSRQWPLALGLAMLVAISGAALMRKPASFEAYVFWSGVGACLGATLGVLREMTRRTITSASALSGQRNFALLGAAPELNAANLRELPPEHRTPAGCLAFMPATPFATAFRDLQGVLGGDRLAVFSCCSGDDGAGLAAMCAAASAAQQGRRTILVDGDPGKRSCTRAMGIEPDQGTAQAVLAPDKWREFVVEEPETALTFLPATTARLASLFDAPGWPILLEHLYAEFELVVVACPPAANAKVCDTIVSQKPGHVILVATWDQTAIAALKHASRALRGGGARVGVFVVGVPEGYRFGRLRPS